MARKTTRRTFLALGSVGLSCVPRLSAWAQDELDAPMVKGPKLAEVLFDGKSLSNWVSVKGGPAGWKVRDGYMEVVPGTGDIRTTESFGDFQLHVDFWLPYMPEAPGQARANSGVYLQGRYEIQVLDSYGIEQPTFGDCGAIYETAAPLWNASKKPAHWQSYDIAFRAPRLDAAGHVKEKGRVTVFHNGIMVQNNQEFAGSTRAATYPDAAPQGPLMLQDHGCPVRYRNIWIVPVK